MHELVEGTLADLHTLMADPPHQRRGNTQLVRPASPAAGQGFTYKIDSSWWERILAVNATLTCSGQAGIRAVDLQLCDGDGQPFTVLPFITAAYANTAPVGRAMRNPPGASASSGTYWATGSQTTPGAGAFITSVAVQSSGFYTVRWSVSLAGTLAIGADANNFQLNDGIGQFYEGLNTAVAGVYPQQQVSMYLAAGNQAIVSAAGLATTGAVYGATVAAQKADGATAYTPLPDFILRSGWSLKLAGGNLQSGDQLSGLSVFTERYPSNWADGALGADTEAQVRALLEERFSGQGRM